MLPWREAWESALYAADTGFYRQPTGPSGHFTTASHDVVGAALARAVVVLARREGIARLVDVGCGRGELLTAVHALDPALDLVGVDVVPRPGGLPDPIRWVRSTGGGVLPELTLTTDVPGGGDLGGGDLGHGDSGPDATLILANEWLDVVPCTVAEVDGNGVLREVLVDTATGAETLGDRIGEDDAAWVEAWWPDAAPSERVEVGRTRDEAWGALLDQLRATGGLAVAVDYGHTRAGRPARGTLTAYRNGVQTVPVPDGSMDITAHVAMDSLPETELMTQRETLTRLGVGTPRPPRDLARSHPAAYLRTLSEHSASAALRAPGYGDFLWAVSRTAPDRMRT